MIKYVSLLVVEFINAFT